MNRYGRDGATVTGVSGQTAVAGHGKDRLQTVRGNDRRRRDSAVTDDEAAVLSREQSATAREHAAQLREDAAHLREGKATDREQDIQATVLVQAATEIHMRMLQQANARLVTATIEAQQLAEQVQATKTELESAKQAAEKANMAKSDFISGMSHDLRSPLNAILGFAQLLETSAPPPTDVQRARLQQIIKAGWYLLELINDILDLSVIESGKFMLSRAPVSLIDVLNECLSLLEAQAKNRGIRVNILPFDNNWSVNADSTRVKQVLINLLSNAVKYNREHGTVEVACTASTPERIRISIKDSGPGLAPRQLAQLFQPFNRLGQEAGPMEGTGIGLVVCKQLVERMSGTIGVESTVGEGSEFWIELVRDATPQCAADTPLALAAHADGTAELHTLLHVEDNPANLLLVEHIIHGQQNLRVLSAQDGNLGVELARIHVPDVILMDINLPGISGIQALNILRSDPATEHIPVIAISANAMPQDIKKGLEAGFCRYLTKPIRVNEFMNVLGDTLKLAIAGNISEMGSASKNETPQK